MQTEMEEMLPPKLTKNRKKFSYKKKVIPVQKLNKFLEYKFNPIVCNLSIATHEGIVREVSFLINRKISSLFSNEDILSFDKVILNTQFAPDYSMKNGIASFSWVIGRKRIRDFLTYNR